MVEALNTISTSERKHGVLFIAGDRVVAFGKNTVNALPTADTSLNVEIPDLREVDPDGVIQINIKSTPATYFQSVQIAGAPTGNVVGLTINQVHAGSTLTAEVVATGAL